jgi:PAS domain S-box-containing protein
VQSDQSVETIYTAALEVFTESSTPAEPRTTAEVATALDHDHDHEKVRALLETLVDRGELQTKQIGSSSRIWWRPVSEPTDTESSLASETEYFDKILTQSSDNVVIVDETGTVKYSSEPIESMLGRAPNDLIGTDSFSFIHPDDRTAALDTFTDLLSDPDNQIVTEFRVEHADGSWRWLEIKGVNLSSDPVISGALMNVRDITARKHRQQEHRETTRRLQAVLDTIESTVFMKDAKGRYRLMNQNCRELLGIPDEMDVSGLTDEDLFPESTAAKFQKDDKNVFEQESTISVEETVPTAVGYKPYLTRKTPIYDESGSADTLCAVGTDITEQKAREQRLKQQRSDLAALNSLNRVFREITDAVLEQSTREEIETTLCEQFAASDSYGVAWLGEVEPTTHKVTVRAQAGTEVDLQIPAVSVGSIESVGQSFAGETFRTGELTVTTDLAGPSESAPSSEWLADTDLESFAAVPITHEATQYGVLGVFTDRDDAFGSYEQAVLTQLGEVVGHAIAATERQRALMSDELIELSFEVENVLERFGLSVSVDGTISYNRSVAISDGGFLMYGTATKDAIAAIEALVEAETAPNWKSVTPVRTDEKGTQFELTFDEQPILSTLRVQAGYIHEAIVENGNLCMTFHFAPTADIQQAIASVKTAFPEATLLTRSRTVRPEQPPYRLLNRLSEEATERQLAALEAAYGAGFFNWPRDSSGESVAESLGISPSTYHQHLRKAQQQLMKIVFENTSE